MGKAIDTGHIELWTERRGHGPDVLLIAGLGDPAEAWQPQLDGFADRYLLTAFDNRGAGRTPLPEGRLSATTIADDAAALLCTLEVPSAHVAGFSMGSAIADRKSTRLNSSHANISYAVFCLKKKKKDPHFSTWRSSKDPAYPSSDTSSTFHANAPYIQETPHSQAANCRC